MKHSLREKKIPALFFFFSGKMTKPQIGAMEVKNR